MKKQLLTWLLIFSLAAALTGCAGTSPSAEDSTEEVETSTSSVLTEDTAASSLKSVHIPQPGEDLATALDNDHLRTLTEDPPVEIRIWIDHGGAAETATLTDEEAISEFIGYFSLVRIDSETFETVTDNDNGFSLTFSDGETVTVRLNLKNLEFTATGALAENTENADGTPHGNDYLFILSDFDDLWRYLNQVAEYPDD